MDNKKIIEKSEKLIKINLKCGCGLGICKKCAPIIAIMKIALSHQKEEFKRVVEGIDIEVIEGGWALIKQQDILKAIEKND